MVEILDLKQTNNHAVTREDSVYKIEKHKYKYQKCIKI